MKTFVLERRGATLPTPTGAWVNTLNPQQLAAVTHGKGPALVVAGAGTGKTRVLTYRVAWLVERGNPAEEILLLTFTRRAAEQMLQRAGEIIGPQAGQVQGGTFHAFAHGVLRRNAALAGFSPDFTVLDESDAADTLDLLRTRLVTGPKRFPKKATLRALYSHQVNRGTSLIEAVRERCPQFIEHLALLDELGQAWAAHKRQHQLMDFDDLLLHLRATLTAHPALRADLARRHRHILVDEYQDTNGIQGDLVELLAGKTGDVLVVGDEAQSIYGFRGADVRNILHFQERFPGAALYRLEQNYRSTQPILDVANAITAQAREGFGKVLFSDRKDGETPLLVACPDVESQAWFVAEQIQHLHREEDVALGEQAVLFRSARHSAELELELTRRGIPFRKYGGQKFFESAHVKDVLAYLKVSQNPRDLVSWHRLLKLVPGVGATTAVKLAEAVAERGDASLVNQTTAPPRAREGLDHLARLFRELSDTTLAPADQIQRTAVFYRPALEERYDDHPRRWRDLEQLVVLADRFQSLPGLLSDLALEPPQGLGEPGETDAETDLLTLSTIHSAKGLEWHSVYVLWAADEYFPSSFAEGDPDAMEEERRLMYVAVTRARTRLLLCYPASVHERGFGRRLVEPSRFLRTLDEGLLEPARLVQAGP